MNIIIEKMIRGLTRIVYKLYTRRERREIQVSLQWQREQLAKSDRIDGGQ